MMTAARVFHGNSTAIANVSSRRRPPMTVRTDDVRKHEDQPRVDARRAFANLVLIALEDELGHYKVVYKSAEI